MDGFININKPQGMTSFDVIRKLRKQCPRKKKIGHLGTLDPMAQGVLPVAIGMATRLIEYLDKDDKSYICTMVFGATSDTQDAWGDIVYNEGININEKDILDILPEFTGWIKQLPPMYSAVHYQGQRLYELARKGVEVEREARDTEIKSLELLSVDLSDSARPEARIKVECSRGTYVRTLCHDIGASLGCGAYMSELIRTRSGVFELEDAVALNDIINDRNLIDSNLKAIDYPLQSIDKVTLKSEDMVNRILNGNQVSIETDIEDAIVKVYNEQGELLSISRLMGNGEHKILQPHKVFK